MRMIFFLTLLVSAIGGFAQAEVLDYKPLTMELKADDRLRIRGFDGSVKLVGRSEGRQMVVALKQVNPDQAPSISKKAFDEWLFSLQRKGNVVEIEVRSPPSKQTWRHLLMSGGMPEFQIEITAPAVPADLAWRSGRVQTLNWSAPLHILHPNGSTLVSGGKGSLKVVGQEGTLTVKKREGLMDLESYVGKVVVSHSKGGIDVQNFAGDTVIAKSEAQIQLSSFRGSSNVSQGSGRIEFDNDRSSLKVSGFKGDLKGSSGQGAVVATLVGDADVRVATKEGAVSLRLPGSGASVNVGSAEGGLYVPSYLNLTRLPNLKLMRGKLRGKNRGHVHVRTESGNIRLR